MNNCDTIKMEQVIGRSDQQVSCDMGNDEVVLLGLENGQYYHLNPTASRIWSLIEAPMVLMDLCATLISEFDVSQELCRQEVLGLVNRFHQDGLISVNSRYLQ